MKNEKQVAIHEAGHIFCMMYYSKGFEYASMRTGEKNDKGQRIAFAKASGVSDDIESLVCVAAGVYAELIAGYLKDTRQSTEPGQDWHYINHSISKRYGSNMILPINKEIYNKALTLLKNNWLAVLQIGEILEQKKFLTHEDVKAILQKYGLDKEHLKSSDTNARTEKFMFDRPTIFAGKYFDVSFILAGDARFRRFLQLKQRSDNQTAYSTVSGEVDTGPGVYRVKLQEPNCNDKTLEISFAVKSELTNQNFTSSMAPWFNANSADVEWQYASNEVFVDYANGLSTFTGLSSYLAHAFRPVEGHSYTFYYNVSSAIPRTTGNLSIRMAFINEDGSTVWQNSSDVVIASAGTLVTNVTGSITMVATADSANNATHVGIAVIVDEVAIGDPGSTLYLTSLTYTTEYIDIDMSETKTIDIDCNCTRAQVQGVYLTWLNNQGGFDYWNFTAEKEYPVEIRNTGETKKNIFPNWPNSYGEFADTIRKQTFRESAKQILVKSQHLTLEQVEAISYIKSSVLVQIVNSIYDRRTVIVDNQSWTKYKESDKKDTYTIQFVITYTDDIPSQRV